MSGGACEPAERFFLTETRRHGAQVLGADASCDEREREREKKKKKGRDRELDGAGLIAA